MKYRGVPPLSDRTGRIGTLIPNQHIGKEAAWGAKNYSTERTPHE